MPRMMTIATYDLAVQAEFGRIRLIVVACLLPVSLFFCLLTINTWVNW